MTSLWLRYLFDASSTQVVNRSCMNTLTDMQRTISRHVRATTQCRGAIQKLADENGHPRPPGLLWPHSVELSQLSLSNPPEREKHKGGEWSTQPVAVAYSKSLCAIVPCVVRCLPVLPLSISVLVTPVAPAYVQPPSERRIPIHTLCACHLR